MELRLGSDTLFGPNGTARMSNGDRLSIAYTDVDGEYRLITIEARAIALVVREQRTGDELFIQSEPYNNVFLPGTKGF